MAEEVKAAADRHNKDKLGLDLIPMDALEELARVYDFGSKKYSKHNWAKGLSWEETRASLMRHLSKWAQGEDCDQESGLPHDIHITWNALTLVAMRARGIGKDDRFKSIKDKQDNEEYGATTVGFLTGSVDRDTIYSDDLQMTKDK